MEKIKFGFSTTLMELMNTVRGQNNIVVMEKGNIVEGDDVIVKIDGKVVEAKDVEIIVQYRD